MKRATLLLLLLAALGLAAWSCAGDRGEDSHASTAGDDDDNDNDDDAGAAPEWWRTTVLMQVFVRSYYDSDGDGIGDLRGLIAKLPYIAGLGVGAIWLNPIYPTPFYDSGYDVAGYIDINPEYGALDDFRELLAAAHELGLRVVMDGVFNHTSIEHPWFVESRASRDNPKRDWYIWADEPTFNCVDPFSPQFGDDRWEFDETTGQYYYHHFLVQMADLNYDNPEVREAIKNVVRFWFDLGVDGFRLDVAHLYYEDADYCAHHPRTHAFHRELRQVADEYDERMLVGEVAGGPDQLTAYLGDGANELHMILNFDLTYAFYAALYLHAPLAVDLMMDAMWARFPPGGTQAVFYSNHDFFRFYGLLFQNDDWAKMAVALQMTLPGTPFVYYGEEVGMGNGREIKIDYRDVARTPMHWDATANAGFTTGEPWMRLAPNHWTNNVAVEDDDPASLLSFYRRIIALRNAHRALQTGDFLLVGSGAFPVYAYFREFGDEALLVVVNMSALTQTAALRLTGTPWGGRSGRVRDLLWGAALPPLTATASGDYSLDVPGFGFAMLKLDAE